MSPFDPERTSTTSPPENGVKVIVRDPPPPPPTRRRRSRPREQPGLRTIVMPMNQPPEDRAAFIRELDEQHGDFICRLALYYGKGEVLPESASELKQEVLLIVHQRMEKQPLTQEEVLPFITGVVWKRVSQHNDKWRAPVDREADATFVPNHAPSPELVAMVAEQRRKVARYRESLTREEAEAIQAINYDDLTIEQAAQALGRASSTVDGQHERGVAKLHDAARESERRCEEQRKQRGWSP